MNGHLGNRVSALVDGQLSPGAAERALAHVAGCPRCASDLSAARAARQVLSRVDDVRPAGDLTARLLALGGPVSDPTDGPVRSDGAPTGTFAPATVRPGTAAGFSDSRSGGAPTAGPLGGLWGGTLGGRSALGGSGALDGSVLGGGVLGGRGVLGARSVVGTSQQSVGGAPHGRRGLRAAVSSLTGLGMVAVALFVLGDRPDVAPATTPVDALSMVGAVGSTTVPISAGTGEPDQGVSTEEYLAWMRAEGWTCPESVPAGWTVTSVRLRDDGRALEVDLSGPAGSVVVTEQQGRLDAASLTAAERIDVHGRTVYLLSTTPWHAAWQSGDTVVEVISDEAGADAGVVVGQFPGAEFDTGLPARLTRGWDTLTAVVQQP